MEHTVTHKPTVKKHPFGLWGVACRCGWGMATLDLRDAREVAEAHVAFHETIKRIEG
jgi:hypothetical protein